MKQIFYIPNLNGLRFLAAFSVIIGHCELTKKWLGLKNLSDSNIGFFKNGGGHLGVVLFFVLSGFLITLLLLLEKERVKKINFRKFIIRRALRIWPVYFIFISFVIFFVHGLDDIVSKKHNGELLVSMYFLILPNLAMSGFGSIMHIAHLWSIGVEEQFYIIWPLILKYLKNKYIILSMLFLIVAIPIIPHLADFLSIRFPEYQELLTKFRLFFQYFLINAMAVGGILAYLYYKFFINSGYKLNSWYSSSIIILCLTPWVLGLHFSSLNDVIYPCIFGILILAVSLSSPLFILENKIIRYLGKISYGIYVYHWIIVYYFHRIVKDTFGELNYFLSLFSVTILTILTASFSYELFEKNILKYKSKFAIIKSGKL